MKTFKLFLILAVSLIACISNVYAYTFGTNITINDNRNNPSGGDDGISYTTPSEHGWWTTGRTTGINPGGEDQEVEPGMWPLQKWDLEGFFLIDEKYLSMVGGYDFQHGVADGGYTFKSGDIFIDTNGNAQYGNFTLPIIQNYGYDYVVHFTSWGDTGGAYDVYKLTDLTSPSKLESVYSYNVPMSNPWRYNPTVNETKVVSGGSFAYEIGIAGTGFIGGTHYAVEGIDLSFLPADTSDFIAHFTMECGNDNLMGESQVAPRGVPEPATMLLLGLGLIGVAAIRRKF